jgi:imidazolonepropionase-like amidohydrolase
MLNLVLYLCAQEPDVEGGLPERPVATKTKKGQRWFPAQKPVVREVGVRTVKWIREARSQVASGSDIEASGRTVAPHMRKAHWHGYWTGPRKDPGARNFSLKWLPPTPVGLREGQAVAPTVRVVE